MPVHNNPYLGPLPFTKDHDSRFFGRKKESFELLSLVRSRRATLLYSQAGIGKTSLLQTRIIPGLENTRDTKVWYISNIGIMVEEIHPDEQPKNIFVFQVLTAILPDVTASKLLMLSLAQGLEQYFKTASDTGKMESYTLILDQFEDFLRHDELRRRECAGFFEQLQEAFKKFEQLSVVISINESYLATLDSFAHFFPDQLRARLRLDCLSHSDAHDAITKPANNGDPISAAIATVIVETLAQDNMNTASNAKSVTPILLQILCFHLWDAKTGDIEPKDVQGFDLDNVIVKYYEAAIRATAAAVENTNELQIRLWFNDNLIDYALHRKRSLWHQDDLPLSALKILRDRFKLIQKYKTEDDKSWYEITNSRLVHPIAESNNTWLKANYDSNPIEVAFKQWSDYSYENKGLVTGKELRKLQEYKAKNLAAFSPNQDKFLAASIRYEIKQRAQLFVAFIVIVAIVAILAALVASRYAYLLRNQQVLETQLASTNYALGNIDEAISNAILANTTPIEYDPLSQDILSQTALYPGTRNVGSDSQYPLLAVSASADGNYIVASSGQLSDENTSDETIGSFLLLWDSNLDNLLYPKIELGDRLVTSIVFSPNSSQFAAAGCQDSACELGYISIWDVANGTRLLEFTDNVGPINAIAYSSDGQKLVSGGCQSESCSRGQIIIWDASSGTRLLEFTDEPGPIYTIAFSPDGQSLVSGGCQSKSCSSGQIITWDASSGTPILEFTGEIGRINTIAFSPDGQKLVSGGCTAEDCQRGEIIVWNTSTGENESSATTNAPISVLNFANAGRSLVSGGTDKLLRIWTLVSDTEGQVIGLDEFAILNGHENLVSDIAILAGSDRIVSSSHDGTLRLWDSEWGNVIERVQSLPSILSFDYSPVNSLLLLGNEQAPYTSWFEIELSSGSPTLVPRASNVVHESYVSAVDISPDGSRALTGDYNGKLYLWDTSNLAATEIVSGLDGIKSLAFAPDSTTFALGGLYGEIVLWDTQNTAPAQTIQLATEDIKFINDIEFSPDGNILAVCSEVDGISLWDIETRSQIRSLRTVGFEDCRSINFNRQGDALASAWGIPFRLQQESSARLIVWNVATGEQRFELEGHHDQVFDVRFSSDGRQILSSSLDGSVIVWDYEAKLPLRHFEGHGSWAQGAILLDSGTVVVSFGCIYQESPLQDPTCPESELVLWRIDPIRELLSWTLENRYSLLNAP